ncbi:MAG: hypothetical protein IPP41_11880 [Rhodocyclaceae bacterium]|nr:hypothetical protein [Rhodocyclaceae bacterium]
MSRFIKWFALSLSLLAANSFAADEPALSSGQTLYLPIYSHSTAKLAKTEPFTDLSFNTCQHS